MRLVAIARDGTALLGAGPVLAAHRVAGLDRLHRLGELRFSVRTASASNDTGGSIAVIAQELEQVVGDHVAQRAGRLVEGAALLDADRLGRGDLDVVDEVAAQIGSNIPLAKRIAMMLCTVSFPRKWSIR